MRRLQAYVEAVETGSLAAHLREVPSTDRTDPAGQIPQWLFAFDAAAMAAFAALALLAAHPQLPGDDFTQEIWLDGTADASWSLMPFSAGPVQCPDRRGEP